MRKLRSLALASATATLSTVLLACVGDISDPAGGAIGVDAPSLVARSGDTCGTTPPKMPAAVTDQDAGGKEVADAGSSDGSLAPKGNGTIINVSPGDSVSAAISHASAGDTVLLAAGTYTEQIQIAKSGVIVRGVSRDSVILDGGGKSYVLVPNGGTNVTIQNMTLRHAGVNDQGNDLAAVRTDDGWVLEDLEVDHMLGVGVGVFGSGVTVHRVVSQYNRSGIGGSSTSNSRMLDCTSAHNIGGSDSGGGKFTRTNGLTVERYTSFDNGGPGIWFDFSNINVVVRDSEFYGNHDFIDSNGKPRSPGRGIMIEISGIKSKINGDGSYTEVAEGPVLIDGNFVHDNDNSGIIVYASKNVTIQNNRITNDDIELKDGRAAPYRVQNLTIESNDFKNGYITADRESTTDYEGRSFVIDGDTYDRQGTLVTWDGKSYGSLSEVQSGLGFEKNGKTASLP